jgi:ferredoxin
MAFPAILSLWDAVEKRAVPRNITVTVRDHDRVLKVAPEPSQNLRTVLKRAKLPLYAKIFGISLLGQIVNCGGRGSCGRCLVRVVDNPAGLTDRTPTEIRKLGPTSPQARLACQAWVCGDITLDLGKTALNSKAALLEEADEARKAHEKMLAEA